MTNRIFIIMAVIGALIVFVHGTEAKAYTDAEYQALIAYIEDVRDNPSNAAVKGNADHVRKWNRVLATLGADSPEDPMPAPEIHANAEKWPDSPWKRPSDYLKWKAAQDQADSQQDPPDTPQDPPQDPPPPPDTPQDTEPDWTDYQTVVDYLIDVRDNPENAAVQGDANHIRKWNRVLEAVGYDTGTSVTPMDEATIHENAANWPDSPWYVASTYLNWVDAQEQASQQSDQVDPQVQKLTQRYSLDCNDHIYVRENDDGVRVIYYGEGGIAPCTGVPNPNGSPKSPYTPTSGHITISGLSHSSNAFHVTYGAGLNFHFDHSDSVYTGDLCSEVITFGDGPQEWQLCFIDNEDPHPPPEDDPPKDTSTYTAQQCIAQDADNDKLLFISVTNRGDGYTVAPTVMITGGGGSGATAVAVLTKPDPNNNNYNPNKVDSIRITNRGSGYTHAPTVTLTGGDGSGATAQAGIPSGRLCGPGGHQVLVDRKTDDPTASVTESTALTYSIYASPPPTGNKTVKVKYTLSGRVGADTNLSGTFDVPAAGGEISINPPDGTNDGNLQVDWSIADGSNYRVHEASLTDTVHIVDDDSIGWLFVEQTLGDIVYEGSGIKLSRIVFDQRHSYLPESDPTNVLTIDFDVAGCALSDTPLADDAAPVAEDADIPCWIGFDSLGSGQTLHRVSGDKFEIRKWQPQTASGRRLTLQFQVGNDADKVDETVTMNPTFAFNNSTGGVVESGGDAGFPESITVTDDDKLDLPDEEGKDTIYILSDDAPTTPTGGTASENHLPTGWSRDDLAPSATENVWRSQRTINRDQNDAFVSASAWSTPEKVLDKVPAEVTVSLTKAAYLGSENNISTTGFTIAATATRKNQKLSKDYLIPWVIIPGTATQPGDISGQQPLKGVAVIPGGLDQSRTTDDPDTPEDESGYAVVRTNVRILMEDDDVYDPDETFEVTIGPMPSGVVAGDILSATITFLDNDPEPEPAQQDEVIRFLGFTDDTQEVDEAKELTVTARLVSATDYEGRLAFNFSNASNLPRNCLSTSSPIAIGVFDVTLAAGVETEVDIVFSDMNLLFNGKSATITIPVHPKDEPDCDMTVSLHPDSRVVDEHQVVIHQGYSIDADLKYVRHDFIVRDLDWTNIYAANRGYGLGDNDRADAAADFYVRLSGASGDGTTQDRDLMRGDVVEFPVRAYRAANVNGTFVKGTRISPDLYAITSYVSPTRSQSNVSVRKISDGYAVKWWNNSDTDEENGPCADNLGITIKKHEAACLNFDSKLPTDDPLWNEDIPMIAFDLSSSADKFGSTNMNPGVRASDILYMSIKKGSKPFQSATDKFEIRQGEITTAEEPDTGYAWIPFDLYAWHGNSFEVTGLAFCVDSGQTTASYYHDYTIYSDQDYWLVSQHPEYAKYITGYAWRNGESCSRALAIPENGTRMYIRVLSDSHDEGTETIRIRAVQRTPKPHNLTLAESDWVTFTITNDGPIPSAWLSRYGRTVAEQYVGAITDRFSASRTPGAQGRFAGQELRAGAHDTSDTHRDVGHHDEGDDDDRYYGSQLDLRDALLNSSFQWSSKPSDDQAGNLSVWGSSVRTDFSGNEDSLSLDGEVTTWMLGADYGRGDWLAGLVAGHTSGDGDYSRDNHQGRLDTSMTSVAPYARWQVSDTWSAWGIAGYGHGDMTLRVDDQRMDASIDWRMVAAGVQADLYATDATRLSLVSDGMWTRTSSDETQGLASSRADVTRFRLGMEGSHAITLGGNTFIPRAEVGLRHDGGDAESGFGVEVGGGVSWSDFALGLSFDVSGRALLSHEDGAFKDRGISASLGFDPRPDSALGPAFSLRQDWGGQAQGGLDSLFSTDLLDDRQGSDATSRWMAEAAYGLPSLGGRFIAIPHARMGLANGERDYTLGWRWVPEDHAPEFSFGIKMTRREHDIAQPDHTVGFEAVGLW